jgi:glutamine cyclotransferase
MDSREKIGLVILACAVIAAIAFVAGFPGQPNPATPAPAASVTPSLPVSPAIQVTPATPVYHYAVVNTYPHDRFAFTEGLAYTSGQLIEATGLNGNSTLRRVDLTTGAVLQERQMADKYFGEGVAVDGDRIVQLTEFSHVGFVYNATTFAETGSFNYSTDGWGIASDGTNLVMSDGTNVFHFLDPVTFAEIRQVRVQDRGVPVESLNELEYVNGEIYANVWPTDRIVRIEPATGNVTGWIDLTGILPQKDRDRIGLSAISSLQGRTSLTLEQEACLNGIAYDPTGDRLFVTGKLWPDLFEIRVVP